MSREHDITAGLEALRYVARGWTMPAIARQLNVNPETVNRRLRKLYGILGAWNGPHAVAIAGMQRLLTADDLRAAAAERRSGWVEPSAGGVA